jgi:hypothetical protein
MCFYLYVIFDIFSRYFFGWPFAARDEAPLRTLTVRADRHSKHGRDPCVFDSGATNRMSME